MTETIAIITGTFLIIILIAIIARVKFQEFKSICCPPIMDREQPMDDQRLKEILCKIGVQLTYANENEYTFNYQGGTFLLSYKPSITAADLIYPNFEEIAYQDFSTAATSANSMNLRYGGWTCYLLANTSGEKEKPISANMSYRVSLLGSEEEIIGMLCTVMQSVFPITREFSADFEKERRRDDDRDMSFLSSDFDNKVSFIRNKLVTSNGELQEQEQVEEGTLVIGSLLKLYEGVNIECMKSMRIVKGNEVERWDDVQKILEFDLQAYLKQTGADEAPAEVVVLLELERDSFIVSLNRAAGCTDKSLYYNMTMERTWYEVFHQQDSIFKQNLIEIRLTSANDDYWEAKYMIDEAKDKAKEGRYGDLTDVQQGILSFTNPTIQTDLYWGKKYFLANCHYQSLAYFRRIYNFCRSNWKELTDEQKGLYYEICFYMGFVYMDLKLREKAFYFLYTAKNANNIESAQEFINCLANINDPFTVDSIQSYLERTNEVLADNDENEAMIEFHRFLNRRLAYALINRKDWDEAEALLNRMIKNEEDVEFAKMELEYLKRIRDSQQS